MTFLIRGGGAEMAITPAPGMVLVRRPAPSRLALPADMAAPGGTPLYTVEAVGKHVEHTAAGDSVVMDMAAPRLPVVLEPRYPTADYVKQDGSIEPSIPVYFIVPAAGIAAVVTRKGT